MHYARNPPASWISMRFPKGSHTKKRSHGAGRPSPPSPPRPLRNLALNPFTSGHSRPKCRCQAFPDRDSSTDRWMSRPPASQTILRREFLTVPVWVSRAVPVVPHKMCGARSSPPLGMLILTWDKIHDSSNAGSRFQSLFSGCIYRYGRLQSLSRRSFRTGQAKVSYD